MHYPIPSIHRPVSVFEHKFNNHFPEAVSVSYPTPIAQSSIYPQWDKNHQKPKR